MRIVACIASLVAWNLCLAQDLVITNARIIDGTGTIIEQGSVVISDGAIVSVSAGTADTQDLEIDARGMTVIPGLINTHWHVMGGVLPAGNDGVLYQYIEEDVSDFLGDLLERGVTTIMSAGDYFPHILELRRKLANGDIRGPRLISVGRQITGQDDWASQLCEGNIECEAKYTAQVDTADEARAVVRELAESEVDALKLVYDDRIVSEVRIDDDVVAAITDEAERYSLRVFAHVTTAEDSVLKLVDLGVRGLVHHDRLQSMLDSAQTLRELQIPVATTIAFWARDWREIEGLEVTEGTERNFNQRLQGIRLLMDEGVTVAFGTDTTDGMHAETKFMIEAQALNQVLSNEEIVSTLTRNAAVYIGMGDELGTLEPGKIADIVLIDGDPLSDLSVLTNAAVVIQGGRVTVDNR